MKLLQWIDRRPNTLMNTLKKMSRLETRRDSLHGRKKGTPRSSRREKTNR